MRCAGKLAAAALLVACLAGCSGYRAIPPSIYSANAAPGEFEDAIQPGQQIRVVRGNGSSVDGSYAGRRFDGIEVVLTSSQGREFVPFREIAEIQRREVLVAPTAVVSAFAVGAVVLAIVSGGGGAEFDDAK